jgi:hypothetical protein
VITSALSEHPGEIALYGWHRSTGEVIQPLYIGATDSMAIFSQGIRLVDRTVLVNGATRDLWDVLGDPGLAQILSDDGVVAQPHYLATRGER